MEPQRMRDEIEARLAAMEVERLEERIAPVKCAKQPDAPECQATSLYGSECAGSECGTPAGCRYGIGF